MGLLMRLDYAAGCEYCYGHIDGALLLHAEYKAYSSSKRETKTTASCLICVPIEHVFTEECAFL